LGDFKVAVGAHTNKMKSFGEENMKDVRNPMEDDASSTSTL